MSAVTVCFSDRQFDICKSLKTPCVASGSGIAFQSGMTATKIETTTTRELNLDSEDRSRAARRGHRLLTLVAISFVFLAVCLMFVDFRRLDQLKHQRNTPSHKLVVFMEDGSLVGRTPRSARFPLDPPI